MNNTSNQQIHFARNYAFLGAFIIPMTILGIFFFAVFTIPTIISLENGLVLAKNELLIAVLLNFVICGLVLFAWLVGYIESSIEFSDEYVKKKGIFRHAKIKWSDVITVFRIGSRVTIKSKKSKIQINIIYFSEPENVIKFVRDHLPKEDISK